MSISDTGSEWSYGTVSERLRDTAYANISDMPLFDEYTRQRAPAPEDAPWPAFSVTGGYEVHVVPRHESLLLWLVESESLEVVVGVGMGGGEQFDEDGPDLLADRLRAGIEGHSNTGVAEDEIDSIVSAARDAAAETFADPFDQDLRLLLQRPVSRWLEHRLANVDVDVDSRGQTAWTLTITEGRDSDVGGTWEPTYPTADLVKQYPPGFGRDYQRRYRSSLHLTNRNWVVWFELSREFLDSMAVVRDYADDDLLTSVPEDYVFQASSSGTYHLRHRGGDEHGCHHAATVDGDQRRFSLKRLPVPTVVCSNCSRRIKELQASETLRSAI